MENILKYFEEFLLKELDKNYYYQVVEYSKSKNNFFEIGIKNIEDIIYDENGELKDESQEYDILIERFIDYLLEEKNINADAENVYNKLIDNIIIYCY